MSSSLSDKGRYIVIEGNDGTGKSSQVKLLANWLKTTHNIESVVIEEPGGKGMPTAIRSLIIDGSIDRDPLTDLLLFTASRNEIWKNTSSVLDKGIWMLSSRNYLSTIAYQGYGSGVDINLIKSLTKSLIGEDYYTPDKTIILTLEDKTIREQRIKQRGPLESPDTFEMKDDSFQGRVNGAYLQIARDLGIDTIDASLSIDEISRKIQDLLQDILI